MQALRRPVAILRMLIGILFVAKGVLKLVDADYLYGGLMHSIEAAGHSFPFYQEILTRFVETHQTLFTYAIPVCQLLVGLSFIGGALVSPAAVLGAVMLVNVAFATAYGSPGRLTMYLGGAVLLIVLGRMGAGLTWGLDRLIVLRYQSPAVLLPLRYSVPAYQKSATEQPPARRTTRTSLSSASGPPGNRPR